MRSSTLEIQRLVRRAAALAKFTGTPYAVITTRAGVTIGRVGEVLPAAILEVCYP